MYFIGIDIGGTKIAICIGEENGNIVAFETIQTQPLEGSIQGIETIEDSVKKLLCSIPLTLDDISAIGISCPGPVSFKEGKILDPPNLKGWENTSIRDEIESLFNKPTFMNNDGNAGAMAEWEFGERKKTNNLIYITASTGIGGGILINGKLLQGESDMAAEVGHYVLDINGPACLCGQKGCFEAFCGAAAITKRVKEEVHQKKIGTKILNEAENVANISMVHIVEAARKKDAYALSIWKEYVERFAQGVGILLMTFNPQVIILGTVVLHNRDLFFKPFFENLPRFAWKPAIECCRIESSVLGYDIGKLGALSLAIDGVKEKSSEQP